MSLEATTRHHNRTIVKAEIGIPRNSIIKYNSVIQGDICSQNAVRSKKNDEQNPFYPIARENQF